MNPHEKKKVGPDAPDLVITPTPAPKRVNVMDLAKSLLSPMDAGLEETRDEIVGLPVGKPNKTQFFRIHPSLFSDVYLLKVQGATGEVLYAVVPGMVQHLDNVGRYTLFLGVHRDRTSFLWPISATSPDGYSRTARQIAISAQDVWCRLVSERATSQYIKRVAPQCKDEPVWPKDKTFVDLLVLAFGEDRIIDSLDHPIVKEMWLK
jgi:hypothetical protein